MIASIHGRAASARAVSMKARSFGAIAAREGAFGTEIQGGITGGAIIGDKPVGYAPGRLIEGSFAGVS